MKKMLVLTLLLFALPSGVVAWSGIDAETETDVEIEKGNLVRRGRTIEIYDASDDSYHEAEVESIKDIGNFVRLEIYDHETGEPRVLLMEKR